MRHKIILFHSYIVYILLVN